MGFYTDTTFVRLQAAMACRVESLPARKAATSDER